MIFLRDVVDNKFANIFSTLEFDLSFQNTLTHENTLHAEFLYHWDLYFIVLTNLLEVFVCICLWVSHIASSLHILKERIFVFMYILNLFFFLVWFVFLFIFPHLLNFPETIFSKTCFIFPIFIEGELPLFSIELICFMFPWFSIFSWLLLCMFFVYLLSIMLKRFLAIFILEGVEIVFEKWRK